VAILPLNPIEGKVDEPKQVISESFIIPQNGRWYFKRCNLEGAESGDA
jgi:hypothetical protein